MVDTTLRTEFTGAESRPIIVAVPAAESDAAEVDGVRRDSSASSTAHAAVSEPRYRGADTWQIDVSSKYPTMDEKSLDLVTEIRDLDAPQPRAGRRRRPPSRSTRFIAIKAGIPLALLILVVVTFITLFLMTGSVVLPIKALLMNVLTITATFGILVLIFQDGRFEGPLDYTSQGALESTQPVFLFAVVFGLSTDYAVFLLTRIKEARDAGAGEREAVALGLQRTGRIVTAAALLFAIALGSFATSRDHLHQAARHRHGRRGADRRDDRPRDARAVADGAARQAQLVGTQAAAQAARPHRTERGRARRARTREGLALEVGDDSQHSPVVVVVRRQVELHEDVAGVLADRLLGDEQRARRSRCWTDPEPSARAPRAHDR